MTIEYLNGDIRAQKNSDWIFIYRTAWYCRELESHAKKKTVLRPRRRNLEVQ